MTRPGKQYVLKPSQSYNAGLHKQGLPELLRHCGLLGVGLCLLGAHKWRYNALWTVLATGDHTYSLPRPPRDNFCSCATPPKMWPISLTISHVACTHEVHAELSPTYQCPPPTCAPGIEGRAAPRRRARNTPGGPPPSGSGHQHAGTGACTQSRRRNGLREGN